MPRKTLRKPPTGKPLSLELTLKHWTALLAGDLSLNEYAYRNQVYRNEFILGVQKHFPQEWEEFKDKIGPIVQRNCAHCGREFYVNARIQKFCKYACREQAWLAVPENAEANRAKINRWRANRKQKPIV